VLGVRLIRGWCAAELLVLYTRFVVGLSMSWGYCVRVICGWFADDLCLVCPMICGW